MLSYRFLYFIVNVQLYCTYYRRHGRCSHNTLGSRDGAVIVHFASHACLPPMWPGFDSRTQRQMWVEFVVGSRPCSERFFSGYSGFPLSSKTNISKFQFDLESVLGPRVCQSYCLSVVLLSVTLVI